MAAQTVENAPAALTRPGAGHQEMSLMPEPAYKRCESCGREFPIDEFPALSHTGYRMRSCRECVRAKNAAKNRRWRKQNPQASQAALARHLKSSASARRRVEAARRVFQAVQNGTLERPDRCARCNAEGGVEGHHADYSKPLEVEWLCKRCHLAEHGKTLRAA